MSADADVQAPASSVSPNKARFSGIWSGWGCQSRACDVKWVVEKLSDEGATIVYVGASASGTLTERVQAVFAGDELKAKLSTGTALSFRIRPGTSGVMEFAGIAPDGKVRLAGVLAQGPAPIKTTERILTPLNLETAVDR